MAINLDPVDPLRQEGYIRPPKEIEEAVLAPWTKNVSVGNISPDGTKFIIQERESLVPIEAMGKPYVNLAGIQIDIKAHRARSLTTRFSTGLVVAPVGPGMKLAVKLPKGARVSSPTWTPKGDGIIFMAHFDDKSLLYWADPKTGNCRPVTSRPLMPTLETGFSWLADGERVVLTLRPSKANPPALPNVADTPEVRVSDSKPNRIRTFPSLLSSPSDSKLLDYYATTQLAIVSLNGKVQEIGAPARWVTVSAAGDGKSFRVTRLEQPWSYLVPASNFPNVDLLIDADGKQLAEIGKNPLRLGDDPPAPNPAPGAGRFRPGGANAAPDAPVDTSKRSLAWRGGELTFYQVGPEIKGADGKATRKDRYCRWKAPYGDKDVETIWETDGRISSVTYGPNAQWLFVAGTFESKNKTILVDLANGGKSTDVLAPGMTDPGQLITKADPSGGVSIRVSKDMKFVYLSGTKRGAEREAPKNWIDKMELGSGKRERLFEGGGVQAESPTLIDDEGTMILVQRQSASTVPQTFLRKAGSPEYQITANKDYLPDLTQARRERIQITRVDGIKFWATVTLPRDYKGGKMPAFFWFYPNEYDDQAAYNRSIALANAPRTTFQTVTSQNKVILLRAGYAVVEPDCPIIGPISKVNDTYVPQLRNNLAATIDALDKAGYIDRDRLGIGGHSYGAFSTLNALVHTPFFKAGIAGDGCYLRPLTPFGFQSEQRQLWEGREVYLNMSPLLYADQINAAVLLYHGQDDQNVGTAPINSIRMFNALEALGKTSAFYMYPYEDHGQAAKETILDQWARFVAFLDKYVKGAK
jgi:dipeptidyl aminopeptidase/acylaminoacyl peptidase